VGALENEALTIRSLLDIEARRNATASKKPIAPKLPIGDYFLRELQSGPKSKDELRDAAAAAGYVSGGENPGRSTHAILLNLIKAHRIMVGPDGKILMMPALDQLMDQPIGTILDVVRNEQRLGDTEPLTKN
jgi:hypothetical protein